MDHQFQRNSKFALLAVENVYTDLPSGRFQLSDGTWVLPGIPVADLGFWNEWIGTIRTERLAAGNLVLFVEEESNNPQILDDVHYRLGKTLSDIFCMLHLRRGIEVAEGADLLRGSAVNGSVGIRQMSQLPTFRQTSGWRRAPLTKDWLEDALILRAGVATMESDQTQFRRVVRGLNTLVNGLQQMIGQDRQHQFVRSLEALLLPDIGRTRRQFARRCQTFACAGASTRALLLEAFDMRSNTEHLHSWHEAVQCYPPDQREAVCCQRARQIEWLAFDAYSRVLRDASIRDHFSSDAATAAFWKMSDNHRCAIWGKPLDITSEPLGQQCDLRGRRYERC